MIALAIICLVLSDIAIFSGGNLSPGVHEDRANRWVIVAFGLMGLLDAYLPAYTDRQEFWTLDGEAIRSTSAAIRSLPPSNSHVHVHVQALHRSLLSKRRRLDCLSRGFV